MPSPLLGELETLYISATGDKVTWKLVKTGEIHEIVQRKVGHSTELFSRLLKEKTALSYDETFD